MKSKVQKRLGQDHANVAQLLDLMDREIARVRGLQSADYDLLREVMRYMTRYPDEVHHPLEDLMFASLVEREPGAREPVERMAAEHEVLAERGKAVLDLLVQVADGSMIERDELVTKATEYTAMLREHMTYENERVFPHADRSLDDAAWADIAARFDAQQDPVFGPARSADFDALLAYIEREAGATGGSG